MAGSVKVDGARVKRNGIVKNHGLLFIGRVQLDLFARLTQTSSPSDEWLMVGNRPTRLVLVRHPRARRYVLRLKKDGSVRVTIPRIGSAERGREFARQHLAWIERQIVRRSAQPRPTKTWEIGSKILYRGAWVELVEVLQEGRTSVRFGDQTVLVLDAKGDLRPPLEQYLRELATPELVARTLELARGHSMTVRRVSVRNQRSRWGSCSRRGTVSLNWRLLQMPPLVRDYIILHELVHFQHMNHSKSFWEAVGRICPNWEAAELWLKQNHHLLG